MTALCGLGDCARPAPAATICEQHWWLLDRALRSVPDLLAELDTALARQTKIGPAGEKVSGRGETAVAFGLGASDARLGLRDALVGWAVEFADPPVGSASLAAAGLLRALPDLRANGQLPVLCDEILDAAGRATRAIDAPAYRSIVDVGTCPEGDCGGLVRAFIPADDRPARMVCDVGEQHWWGANQWYRVGARIRERAGAL